MPISVQTWRVMRSLSPLRIFTSTPACDQRAHRVGGIAFRRIDEEREACEGELVFVAFG